MTRNLLSEVRSGAVSADEADTIANDILASPDATRVVEQLGLSKKEYTAYMHGTPFDLIARWRYEGWPTECGRCHKPIDSDQYGWTVRETASGSQVLEHITCR